MPDSTSVFTVSLDAIEMISGLRDQEPGDSPYGLLIEITGTQGSQFAYALSFAAINSLKAGHLVEYHDDLAIIVPEEDIEKFRGAKLSLSGGGLAMDNPNRPESPAMWDSPGDLEGPLADQVVEVLATRVNPAIAGHGGMAELVSVDGSDVYLRMMGGCQGCGMAQVTLRQGIERILRESIPEITEVFDVTDHATGEHPFYESAPS